MEKTSLKQESLSTPVELSGSPPESNTSCDNLNKNAVEGSGMENKPESGLILEIESSFTPFAVNLHEDDRIASLLSSCTLENAPHLEDEENKDHERASALPGRSLAARPRKKLLVLDLNGLLADIVNSRHATCKVQKRIRGRPVFKRPFCDEFLNFCFENFDAGVWTSRRRNNCDRVVDYLLGQFKDKLLFVWDQSKCTDTGVKTLENDKKPIFLKELKKIWNEEAGLSSKKGELSPSNTMLLDDSPYKALMNPPHTAIFPYPYHYDDGEDNSLGPGGDIRVYLEQLVMADDVQQYVKDHPFGQSPITASHQQWDFYSKIIKHYPTELS